MQTIEHNITTRACSWCARGPVNTRGPDGHQQHEIVAEASAVSPWSRSAPPMRPAADPPFRRRPVEEENVSKGRKSTPADSRRLEGPGSSNVRGNSFAFGGGARARAPRRRKSPVRMRTAGRAVDEICRHRLPVSQPGDGFDDILDMDVRRHFDLSPRQEVHGVFVPR